MRIGALEAGGTKMVCAIGDETGKILERTSFPTTTPKETIPLLVEYFESRGIEALGIGSFGPIDLDRTSATYGYITSTPKLAWKDFDLVGAFAGLKVPIGFDTDVNASAIGEAAYGITRDVDCSIYMTVGTGIGVGIMMDGKPVHGMLHPEAGHMMMRRHKEDSFAGVCPYHDCCLEGLASGPSIEKRFGISAKELPEDHIAWEFESFYLAQALINICMVVSPKRMVLGGGVMHKDLLFSKIREKFKEMCGGYLKTSYLEDLDSYIVPYSLEDNQGIMGCVKLGLDAFLDESSKEK